MATAFLHEVEMRTIPRFVRREIVGLPALLGYRACLTSVWIRVCSASRVFRRSSPSTRAVAGAAAAAAAGSVHNPFPCGLKFEIWK